MSSSSSYLREEAIQMETVEEEMDEFRRIIEKNQKTSGKVGDAQQIDVQKDLGRDESQMVESAISQSIAVEKSQSREAATSSSNLVRSEGIQQELVTGEVSQGNNTQKQQSVENIVDRHMENQKEGETGESHEGYQEQGNRADNSQDNSSMHHHQRVSNFNRVQETNQQHQLPVNIVPRISGSRHNSHSSQKKIQAVNSSELLNTQGTTQGIPNLPPITSNYDVHRQESERVNREAVRNQNYNNHFPKISTNFDRPNSRNVPDKNDLLQGNNEKFPKKDQTNEAAPLYSNSDIC